MKNITSRKGFTVVEVVIACAIFAIGVMGVYGLAAWLMHANDFSGRMTVATSVAQAKMEYLMAEPFTTLSSGSETTADDYTVTWRVISINARLKSILIEASWTDARGKRHQMDLSCLKDS